MSLKAFHIVFVTASTLLCIGFSAWSVKQYFTSGRVSDLVYGIASLIAAVGLVIYGKYFLKKLKHISYL